MGNSFQVGDMVQRGKALVDKPDGVSLIPRTHLMEGENRFPKIVL